MDRIRIGALPVDRLSFSQALDAIARLVEARRGGTVFTPNVDHVVIAETDARLRAAYETASLSLVDGMPLLWASRLLGTPLPEKISGSDLVMPLVRRAEASRWRVFLFGGAPGVAERAAGRLRATCPRLRVVGTAAPVVRADAEAQALRASSAAVRAARPDLVLVALGAPKQEVWAAAVAEFVQPAVLVCVGAGLDFVAGTARRAPRWVSNVGLEWAYRLAQEPRRMWRRYLARDPRFAWVVARALLAER